MQRYFAKVMCFALASVWLAGCWAGRGSTPWDDLKKLQNEKTDLAMQVERLQTENTQLEKQVQTLSGLDKHMRVDALDTLAEIRIGKYTGFYDKDKDGVADSLIVYVEPLDGVQDYIKAVGRCDVQVWNLNASPQQAMLAEWSVTPEELHKSWGGTVFAAYYRLQFPIGSLLAGTPDELTVKVAFTDFLTGKVLSSQNVISNSPQKL